MASEIRVNKINSSTGVGTITLSPTGVDISGVTTASTLRATTGIVTTLTATSSAKVGSGVTLSPDGDIFATGVCTATTFSGSGASLTNLPAANLTGTLPAISGANLTGISGVSVASQADNRLITCTGTSDALTGESNLSFTSNTLTVHEASLKGNQLLFATSGTAYIDHSTTGQDIQFRTSVSSSQDTTGPTIKSTGNIAFASGKGIDFSAESGSAAGSSSALLDDYEQGSFTATCSNSVTLNSSQNTVYYIKVGNLVTVQAEIRIDDSQSGADLVINNLPFVATNHSTNFCPGPVGTYNHAINSGTSWAFCKTTQNQSTISFQCAGQNGTFASLDAVGAGYIAFTLVYFTTF